MKLKTVLFFILFSILPVILLAQEKPIIVKKAFGGTYKFVQGDKKMRLKEVIPIMQSNPDAYALILKAQKTKRWYWGAGVAGLGLMGLQIVTGGDPVPNLGVVGIGLVIATFPLLIIHGKLAKKAVSVYNTGLSTAFNSYILNLGTSKNGVGFVLKF